MKSLILGLIFLPSISWAGGIELFRNPKAILNSTNTWTASQTFASSTTFTSPITVPSCIGCGGGSGSASLQSPATGPYNLNRVGSIINSTGVFVSSGSVGIGTDTCPGLLCIDSNTQTNNLVRISTNGRILMDMYPSSFTLNTSTVIINSGQLIVGTTIQNQVALSQGFINYIMRVGPKLSGPTGVINGLGNPRYFFSDTNATTRMVLQNNSGILEWGVTSTSRFIGSGDANDFEVRANGNTVTTWDSSGNLTPAGTIRQPNGTTALPSLTWTNCTSCGLSLAIGNKDISLSASSLETQRWFTNGGTVINSSATVGMLVSGSSITAGNVITSTTGFIGASSTFTASAFGVGTSSSGFGVTYTTGTPWVMIGFSSRGYITQHGAQASLSSCGTSTLNDHADSTHGTVSVVGVVTACTINFGNPFINAPSCVASDNNTGVSSAITSRSNSAITVGFSLSLGGGEFSYHCDPND